MPVTRFDRVNLGKIEKAMADRLKPLTDALGLNIKGAGGKFGEMRATLRFEITVRETSTGVTAAKAEWDRNCRFWGFTPEQFGATFRGHNGVMFKIVGCAPSRPKNPIKIERMYDGSPRICPPSFVTLPRDLSRRWAA